MKIFGKTFFSGTKRSEDGGDDSDDHLYDILNAGAGSGIVITEENVQQIVAVYACIRVTAESLGTLPIPVYERQKDGGRERADSHPVAAILRRPNPWQSRQDFIEMMTWHLELRGNAYARIDRNRGNRVVRLVPLHPDRTSPQLLDDGSVVYEFLDKNGRKIVYPQNEIFHIKMHSQNGLVGTTPIGQQADALEAMVQMSKYSLNTFKNGASLSGVLTHPGRFKDKETQKRVLSSWNAAYSGAKNAGKVAILEEGMTWSKMGMTAQDAQFLDQKRLSIQEVCSMFRVPPHKIGDLSSAKYANIETQNIEFVTDTLLPFAERWEAEIEYKLFDEQEREKYYSEFLFAALLRGDQKSRNEALQIQRLNGIITTNEWRRLENMNPIGTEGDIRIVPMNMEDLKLASVPKNPQAAPTPKAEAAPVKKEVKKSSDEPFINLFTDQIDLILTKQGNAVRKAAKGENYSGWVAEFLPKHKELVSERLGPTIECLTEFYGATLDKERSLEPLDINDFCTKLLISEDLGKDEQRAKAQKLATELISLVKDKNFKDLHEQNTTHI